MAVGCTVSAWTLTCIGEHLVLHDHLVGVQSLRVHVIICILVGEVKQHLEGIRTANRSSPVSLRVWERIRILSIPPSTLFGAIP